VDIPPEHRKDIESMPAELRRLVEEELAAGNEIAEVGHAFPAASGLLRQAGQAGFFQENNRCLIKLCRNLKTGRCRRGL
jgi:hypothetical protein